MHFESLWRVRMPGLASQPINAVQFFPQIENPDLAGILTLEQGRHTKISKL
jgi:hypothetical protein